MSAVYTRAQIDSALGELLLTNDYDLGELQVDEILYVDGTCLCCSSGSASRKKPAGPASAASAAPCASTITSLSLWCSANWRVASLNLGRTRVYSPRKRYIYWARARSVQAHCVCM